MATEHSQGLEVLFAWPGFLFVRSFSWLAAIKAPEVIKNPKPRAALTTHLGISPGR